MDISSTTRSTTLLFRGRRPAWRVTAGALAAVAVVAVGVWAIVHPGSGESFESAARQSGSRPLFSGWVKPGSDFGQTVDVSASTQPKWVLATEPNEQEVQALQSALGDHPDKANELSRLIEYSRFQKQVALWSELRSGPMDSERSTLGAHLLEALPAHYNRGELMGPQALLMAQALIRDIEPNPERQDDRLAEARTRLEREAPPEAPIESEGRAAFEFFRQQQQQIVTAHSGTQQQLEARLDAARRSILDPSSAASTQP